MTSKRIILFELNEVPLRIVDQYCRWRPRSNLARRLPQCHVYETLTEDVSHLTPWMTWPSVHRGVSDEHHMIHEFGQPLEHVDQEFPPLWTLLTRGGISTGVFGSLHSYPMPRDLNNYAFYLPDTFAIGSECFPQHLKAFQEFQLRMARESARNISEKLPWGLAFKLLARAPELGLKPRTFIDIGSQLLLERAQRWRNVRRRTYQAVMAFDIFMNQLETTRPAFCNFFSNHVASSMHRYWAAAFPDDFDPKEFGYEGEWVNRYRNEIEFTMHKADEMIERLMKFVDRNPGYQLWLATSMGQAACNARPLETQLYATEPDKLMSQMGLGPGDWSQRPAMLPHLNVAVSPAVLGRFREVLARSFIAGQPIKAVEKEDGFFSLHLGQPNLYDQPQYLTIDGRQVPFAEAGLKNVEIDDKSGTSGYHVPEGTLLIYDGTDLRPKTGRPQISNLEIAPTILRNFGLEVPDYMKRPAALGTRESLVTVN
jgi:hypothetical protein